MSQTESKELIRKIISIESEHYEEIAEKKSEIKKLKEIITENEKSSKITKEDLLKEFTETTVEIEDSTDDLLTEEVLEIPNELNEEELEIFIMIENAQNPTKDSIIRQMKHGKKKSEYILNEFIEKGYVDNIGDHSIGYSTLRLTKKGIKYGIDNGLII